MALEMTSIPRWGIFDTLLILAGFLDKARWRGKLAVIPVRHKAV
jgi:hypothetical protein